MCLCRIKARQAGFEIRLDRQVRQLRDFSLTAFNVELHQVLQCEVVANHADRNVELALGSLVAQRAQQGIDHVQRFLLPLCAIAGSARQQRCHQLQKEVRCALGKRIHRIRLGKFDAASETAFLLVDDALEWVHAAGEVVQDQKIILAAVPASQ